MPSDNRRTVLVVDDNEPVASIMDDLLSSRADFCVLKALTYAAARRWIESEHLDVIVCDVILDVDTSGIELCAVARVKHPNIAVVLISGDFLQNFTPYPLHSEHLQKPFSASQLLDAIQRASDAAKQTSS
jgi:DNA-binding NtrC family response regulator